MNYKKLFTGIFFSGVLSFPIVATQVMPAAAAPETSTRVQSEVSVKWEPLARIQNPKQSVTIELNNQTQETLEYLITTRTDFRTLASGQKTRLIVEASKLPVFLNINATSSTEVKYLLKVTGNTVMVDLQPTDGPGDTTLNIQETGGIFVY